MAELAQQTQIEVVDEVGKLAKVTEALKRAGVNIRAAVAWVEGANGHMRMVTDDNDKACQAVADLVSYLDWMAEPAGNLRKRLGVWVLLFIGVFFVLAWRLNAAYWKDIK